MFLSYYVGADGFPAGVFPASAGGLLSTNVCSGVLTFDGLLTFCKSENRPWRTFKRKKTKEKRFFSPQWPIKIPRNVLNIIYQTLLPISEVESSGQDFTPGIWIYCYIMRLQCEISPSADGMSRFSDCATVFACNSSSLRKERAALQQVKNNMAADLERLLGHQEVPRRLMGRIQEGRFYFCV